MKEDRNGDGADAVRQKVPAMLNSDVLPASAFIPDPHAGHTRLTVRFMSYGKTEPFLLMKHGSMILSEAFGRMKKRLRL